MNNAGRNVAFEKVLDNATKLISKKIGFLCKDNDPISYVGLLSLQLKEDTGKIIFKDQHNELIYCPCITKFAKITNPSVQFPNDKKRNPYECAKIQYILCRLSENKAEAERIRNHAVTFKCNCKDCYRLTMEGIFRDGSLCL